MNRRELVQALGISVQNNPELMKVIPSSMFEKVQQIERDIELHLGFLKFDINRHFPG
jgi:hypothetical protein